MEIYPQFFFFFLNSSFLLERLRDFKAPAPICIMFFYVFLSNIIKLNHLSYHFVTLFYLIYSFSLTRSSLIPYANVSIELIYCTLLSSFEIKAILLISSIKTLCLSLLSFCCVFNIDLRFLINS